MTSRRVVITGVGAVTALGNDVSTTLAALARGESACVPATHFDAEGFHQSRAAEVRAFDPRDYFAAPKAIKLTSRATQFAVAAASMALDVAAWPRAAGADGLGILVGTSGSDLQVSELARALGPDPGARATRDIPFFADRILSGLHPFWLLINLPNMTSAQVAIQCEARGPNSTIMTDWVAGTQAIGEAFDWIRAGTADAVLAGGSDSGVLPFAYGSYEQGGLFGAREHGESGHRFVPGEGAALLLLEERTAALARGARVLGEILGYATACLPLGADGNDGGALALAMRGALRQAGWAPADLRTIVHASVHAGRFPDLERAALTGALGGSRADVLLVEHTSRLGHALAAAGPIDVALMVAAGLQNGGGGAIICSAVGYSGQAATLAFVAGGAAPGYGLAA